MVLLRYFSARADERRIKGTARLTLMKGDEVIETHKECPDSHLFGKGWRWDCLPKEVRRNEVVHHC